MKSKHRIKKQVCCITLLIIYKNKREEMKIQIPFGQSIPGLMQNYPAEQTPVSLSEGTPAEAIALLNTPSISYFG